jgi:ABC-type transport system substrate-binding protein/mono/diheme cytochrome c family protein
MTCIPVQDQSLQHVSEEESAILKRSIAYIGLILHVLSGVTSSYSAETPTTRGELRLVDASPSNWMSIALNVFGQLIEPNADGNMAPGLATGWQWLDNRTLAVTLRQGVKFHNGEDFDAAIVKLNWEAYARLQQPHMLGEFLNFKPGSRLEIIDPYTVRFHFPEPDGAAPVKLSALHIASQQFHTERGWGEKQWGMLNWPGPWGTGPYQIVEGFFTNEKRSDRIVLEAHPHYWDASRLPRLHRIVFDNALSHRDALELVKSGEGLTDMVSEVRPVETLSVAQSPFAKVVTRRGTLVTVFGQFNMRKAGSPWRDVRLRRAINLAVNREELLRDIKGQGVIIPALAPKGAFGYDPALTLYPFDPDKARHLLREAVYPDGLVIALIAPEVLQTQAISISMMLEQAGFTVDLQVLDTITLQRRTRVSDTNHPPEQQTWDIALQSALDHLNFPLFLLYHYFALDGPYDWVNEQPELRQLYEQALHATDGERQQSVIRQMERHTHDQAYFLFLYNPDQLYAVNKAVESVPYATTLLSLAEATVTDEHWSVRKTAAQQAPSETQSPGADPNNAGQVALGQQVYVSFCAGCHGANLEGQPDWQKRLPLGNFPAPPHDETGHTWHHADQWLFDIVKDGGQRFAPPRYRSAMPAYRDMLTDEEIWAVLAFIQSRWPSSIRAEQARLNARGQ